MTSKLGSLRLVLVLGLLMALIGGPVNGLEMSRKVIRGRVVSVGNEEPVPGATVIIRGVGRATTNQAGRYKMRVRRDIAGLRQVVVTAVGHLRRKTWLHVSDSATRVRADWNVMPQSSPTFDSTLFDQLTRRGSRSVGTSRWEKVPVVRILTRKIDCPGRLVPDEGCPEWIVSSSPVSGVIMEWFQAVVQDLPPLIGGSVPAVELVDLPAGAAIELDSVLVPGAVTLGQRGEGNGNVFPVADFGEAIDGFVHLVRDTGTGSPRDILRAVAFGLGYRPPAEEELCAELFERGLRSVHCLAAGGAEHPTALDAGLGRALYTRPVGNRFPDTDPKPSLGATSTHRH